MTVASILKRKGTDVVTIPPGLTVAAAAREMTRKEIGSLVVSEDGRTVLGLIGERDIVRGLAFYGPHVGELRVADLMTRSVVTCEPEQTVTAAMGAMTQYRARHLPVVQDRTLCGLVSIGDAVKHRLEELEMEAHILREAFIGRQ
jgi:CBS domain-containing protein